MPNLAEQHRCSNYCRDGNHIDLIITAYLLNPEAQAAIRGAYGGGVHIEYVTPATDPEMLETLAPGTYLDEAARAERDKARRPWEVRWSEKSSLD